MGSPLVHERGCRLFVLLTKLARCQLVYNRWQNTKLRYLINNEIHEINVSWYLLDCCEAGVSDGDELRCVDGESFNCKTSLNIYL